MLRRPELHVGAFVLHACRAAWDGNTSFVELVAFSWTHAGAKLLVAVNLADSASQCFVELGWADMVGDVIVLADTLSEARYERHGGELLERGLYLDMPAWGYHVFDCRAKV